MKDVTAAIIIKDNKILITRRGPGQKFEGYWEFPGGKCEPNESPEECLRREIKEELNIDVEIQSFFAESVYEYPEVTIRLLAYIARIVKSEIILSVHDRIEFVEPQLIKTFKLLPADYPIVQKIEEVLG